MTSERLTRAPHGVATAAPRLFVSHTGDRGPRVILLHGLGSSGRYWRLVMRALGPEVTAICPDLLGFGRSPRPHVAYSLGDHLAALDALWDELALGDRPIVLAGHSTGAVLALEWAAAHPERFRGVALLALPAYRSEAEARAHIGAISPLAWATAVRPDLGELICGVMCVGRPLWQALLPLLMPRVPADIARDFVLHDWISYSGTLQHLLVEHRVAPAARRLAASGVPVQLLHGAHDRTAPPAAARELAEALGWRITLLEDRAHGLPLEVPRTCADVVRSLL